MPLQFKLSESFISVIPGFLFSWSPYIFTVLIIHQGVITDSKNFSQVCSQICSSAKTKSLKFVIRKVKRFSFLTNLNKKCSMYFKHCDNLQRAFYRWLKRKACLSRLILELPYAIFFFKKTFLQLHDFGEKFWNYNLGENIFCQQFHFTVSETKLYCYHQTT